MAVRCTAPLFSCVSAPRCASLTFFSPRSRKSLTAGRPGYRRFVSRTIALLFMVGLAAFSFAQGTLTTSDGLTLSLSSTGVVNSLKLGSTSYGSAMPSGFFYRELAATTSNAMLNGSFESGSGTPTNWTISGGTGGSWSIDTTTFSAGARSMKVSIPGTTILRSPDLTSSTVAILPNTPYNFTYSIRTSGLSYPLDVQLFEVDSLGNTFRRELYTTFTGTNGWTPFQMNFVSGANAAKAYCVAFIYHGYGTAWLDDVQLVDIFGGNQPINFSGSVTSS